jgi:hypothetical protein
MSDWVWQVPIAVGVMALAYRCVRAPYEIHIATIAAQNTAETELAKLRGQNYGIEVVCSNLVLTWESIPEMPPGVLIALDVAQIVNANTYDAALRVKLMVPLWRLRRDHGADLTVSVSSRPLMSTPSIVKSKLPQLPPVINIRAKHAVGPGLFLFFLSSGSIKAYDFAPVDTKDMSLDDVARLVGEAEMYIEVTDVANRVVLPPVLLPGTDEKRRKRLRSQ